MAQGYPIDPVIAIPKRTLVTPSVNWAVSCRPDPNLAAWLEPLKPERRVEYYPVLLPLPVARLTGQTLY